MNPRKLALAGLILLCIVPLLAIAAVSIGILSLKLAVAMSGMSTALGMTVSVFKLRHADLTKTKALPDGAATVTSNSIQLHSGGDFLIDAEIEIESPALTTAELPDTETMIYDLYHDDDSAFGSEALLADNVLTQTGAGGAGAATQTVAYRPPTNVKKHVRFKATNSGAGDASGKSGIMRVVVAGG